MAEVVEGLCKRAPLASGAAFFRICSRMAASRSASRLA